VNSDQPSRRNFLASGAASGLMLALSTERTSAAPKDAPFEFEEATVADLREAMRSGKHTARSIAEIYLARIEAIDRQGTALRSVIELNPDALAIADRLDKERNEKGPRGPLHGIPILIKDNIDTADRMATTAGSLALVGAKPAKDAFLIKKLRDAGALIFGKTNLSEWANIRCTYSTSGWSARGGLTRNPYALDRNPCGSSSGSGVAVAANLCAVAVGTETDGSIVCPASANGIVGVKPTVGLVSRSGVIPISHTQDSAGPMSRTVRDAAILLGALAGADADDSTAPKSDGKIEADYTKFLDAKGLNGARIGVARNFFGFHDAVDGLMNEALDVMKKEKAVLVYPANLPTFGEVADVEMTVMLYELKAGLNAYLAGLGPEAPVRSLKDVIDFNIRNKAKEMHYFSQDNFLKAQEKGPLTEREYRDALAKCRRLSRTEGIDAVMTKLNLDAFVAPTMGPACLTDLVVGDRFQGNSSTAAAVAGYPAITVPAGMVFGLPVGITFFGRAWSEPVLFKLTYAFEQATKLRKLPRFLAAADLKG
jgi:amidase